MDLGVNERGEQVVELFAGFIPVSAEGKARARRQLDEARARMPPEQMPPERFAQLREELGFLPRTTTTNFLVRARRESSPA